jgi:hypothetical protein
MPRHTDLPFSAQPGRGADESDLFASIVYHVMTTLRVCIPATVKVWSPDVPGSLPATVEIELDFLRARAIDNDAEVQTAKGETLSNEPAGKKAVGPWPRFVRVPIVYPGGPSFGIRGPIDVGTTGLYIIADRCIDQWLNTGGPLDPAVAVKHDINDGIFLPSVYSGANSPEIPTDVHRLGRDDGSAGVEIAIADKSIRVFTDGPNATIDAATLIKLGELATEAITKAESLIAAIDGAWAAATPVANDGGAALKASWIAYWAGVKNTIKATKGRTE